MALSVAGWVSMLGSVTILWGTALWALYRSLHDEGRKLELIEQQGEIDTYPPRALSELRGWIKANPDDPLVDEARSRYNECVEVLQRVDETFYDWSDEEIQTLEKL